MSNSNEHRSTDHRRDSGSVHSLKISIKRRRTGEFIARNSLLTDLFQISHINCVRNALTAGFVLMMLRYIINDCIHNGRLNWTFDLLLLTVGKLHIVVIAWSLMTLCTSVVVFYGTSSWANNRKSNGISLRFYDLVWLMIYVCYLTALLLIPCGLIIKHKLPFVSTAIIIAEQLRQLMKTHSFVRETIEKKLQQEKNSTSDQQPSIPFSHFHQYLYFLFAPTLLYRDVYPRTSTIQWPIVLKMFGQFLICALLVYHLLANYWMPVFTRCFATDHITIEFTMSSIFDLMFPGTLIVILCFYGFFHCWMNGFAELLRFADRMFYEDWWNLTSAATFWRSWNVIVHDWLYVYVYKDLSKLFGGGSRNLSTAFVVILSAIFHEYFMIVSFGFFSPILIAWFALFGMLFRFAFPRAKGAQWNIVLLTFVPICAGLIPYLYALEISARYSPLKRKTFWDFISNAGKQSKSDL